MKIKLTGVQYGEGGGDTHVLPIVPEEHQILSSAMINWVKKHIYWVLPVSGMLLGGGGTAWYNSPGQPKPGQPIVQQGTPGQPAHYIGQQVPGFQCQQTVPCQPVFCQQQPVCQPQVAAPAVVAPQANVDSETDKLLKSLIEKMDSHQKRPRATVAEPQPKPPIKSCPCPVEQVAPQKQMTGAEQRQYEIWVERR